MKLKVAAAGMVIVASIAAVSAASGGSGAQRLTITAKDGVGAFVLAPQTRGMVRRDTGTVEWCCWSRHYVTRDGQKAEINDPIATLTGSRGMLAIRFRIEWLDAGRGYTVGTSTWTVVRGTGAYAGMTGHGRAAQVWIPPDHPASFRADGFVKHG
jgi:hypothetical protein